MPPLPSRIEIFDVSASAKGAFAIVPSDTQDLPWQSRFIYVGSGGVIRCTFRDNDPAYQVTDLVVRTGEFHPVGLRRVFATGTTAANLVALM